LEIISSAKEQIKALAKGQRGLIYIGATLTIGEYILPNILAFLCRTWHYHYLSVDSQSGKRSKNI